MSTILASNGLRPQYRQTLPTTTSMLVSLTPFTTMAWNKLSPTTREDNTLDLLITNNPSSSINVIVKPGISDHEVVLASLDVNIPRINQVRRKMPLFNKADWCRFPGQMISIHNSIQDMAMTCSVDDLWSTFKQGIITGIEKYISHKFAKVRNCKPWVKKPLQRLIAKRNRHYSKYRATGSRYHKDKYKQTKAQVQKGVRSSYWAYVEDIATSQETRHHMENVTRCFGHSSSTRGKKAQVSQTSRQVMGQYSQTVRPRQISSTNTFTRFSHHSAPLYNMLSAHRTTHACLPLKLRQPS